MAFVLVWGSNPVWWLFMCFLTISVRLLKKNNRILNRSGLIEIARNSLILITFGTIFKRPSLADIHHTCVHKYLMHFTFWYRPQLTDIDQTANCCIDQCRASACGPCLEILFFTYNSCIIIIIGFTICSLIIIGLDLNFVNFDYILVKELINKTSLEGFCLLNYI